MNGFIKILMIDPYNVNI